jgi:hypothetical protein
MLLCVKCPLCRYQSMLDEHDLSRLNASPETPVAALLRKLRCEFCGHQAVKVAWEDDDQALAAFAGNGLAFSRSGGGADGGRSAS